MATSATDADFWMRALTAPDAPTKLFTNPNGMIDSILFTPNNERDVYDAIDVSKNAELLQDGKVVVISGARGIGRATALAFAQANVRAIGICARTQSELEKTREEVTKVNPKIEVFIQRADVRSASDVGTFFKNVKDRFGTIDVAISNAGSNSSHVALKDSAPDSWWKDWEVNVKGTYLFSKYFLSAIGESPGTLINITSIQAISAMATQTSYGPSKLAAVRLMEAINFEQPNVRVFSLHPGGVDTELNKDIASIVPPGWCSDAVGLSAAACLYLASPRAEFLRGRWISANWRVDELEEMKQTIVDNNLLKTAFNANFRPA